MDVSAVGEMYPSGETFFLILKTTIENIRRTMKNKSENVEQTALALC